ncbi:MAG TPA: hypothetical protein PLK99_13435, partial [Burkholderiales bacterium]|nr:hypothetical protein [Burkholderiales bacterium]
KKRLSMYIFRSKVSITDTDLAAVGLSGNDAESLLDSVPDSVMGISRSAQGIVIRLSGSRFEIVAEPEISSKIRESIEDKCEKGTLSYWDRLEILDAI